MRTKVATIAYSRREIGEVNRQLRGKPTGEVLRWVADAFGSEIVCASSFGAEDMVLIDMIAKIDPSIRIFTLDTGRLHDETFEVMERARVRYGLPIHVYFPDREAVEWLEREKGFYTFRESIENRRECCAIRKVEPFRRALAGMRAWMTGLRRAQSVTRNHSEVLEWDEGNGLVKVAPLIGWSHGRVWEYIRANDVPYNVLHDRGFPSIGCAPCTRAIKPGEDIRAGRWWWEHSEKKECGIHL